MKTPLFFLTVFLIPLFALAQFNEIKSSSVIKEVNLYTSGASITRTSTVNIPAGKTKIIFTGITDGIDINSIRVSANGNFTILSVKHDFNYMVEENKEQEIVNLENKIEKLQAEIDEQSYLLSIYKAEEEMLLANRNIGGTESGVNVADLQTATDYFRKKLMEIKELSSKSKEVVDKARTEMLVYQNQIKQIGVVQQKKVSEISVIVSANTAVSGFFTIEYLVLSAGWTADYDFRSDKIGSPLKITLKANVKQNSGEDWKNVKLTISTGNPNKNLIAKYLTTWNIGYNIAYNSSNSIQSLSPGASSTVTVRSGSGNVPAEDVSGTIPLDVTQVENLTNLVYEIATPYSIPSDNDEYQVELGKYTLDATYEYFCSPKVSSEVFIVARVSGWDKYSFLSGNSSMFFDETYLGRSFFDAENVTDTLNLSFGTDENIVVQRERNQNFTEEKVIGNNKQTSLGFTITARNKRAQPITLVIEDQIPVSASSEIEVLDVEHTGGVLDPVTGRVLWILQIPANSTKELTLKFTLKYPKRHILQIH